MRAGHLKHRVEVQERRGKTTSVGAADGDYVTVESRWAAIEPIQGREVFLAAQTQSRVTHRVRMRFFPGLTSRHRLVENDARQTTAGSKARIFNIVSVVNTDERDREHELLCVEGAA